MINDFHHGPRRLMANERVLDDCIDTVKLDGADSQISRLGYRQTGSTRAHDRPHGQDHGNAESDWVFHRDYRDGGDGEAQRFITSARVVAVESESMQSDSRPRHGFERTICGCAFCQVHCRHLPGALDPADLPLLCPPECDVFAWAEQHLRALDDKPYPVLVPARRESGVCHWYLDGQCLVHAQAPYGCAFFDSHMPEAEIRRRTVATVEAIERDVAARGLYYRVWLHLKSRGCLAQPGNRTALFREMVRLRRRRK